MLPWRKWKHRETWRRGPNLPCGLCAGPCGGFCGHWPGRRALPGSLGQAWGSAGAGLAWSPGMLQSPRPHPWGSLAHSPGPLTHVPAESSWPGASKQGRQPTPWLAGCGRTGTRSSAGLAGCGSRGVCSQARVRSTRGPRHPPGPVRTRVRAAPRPSPPARRGPVGPYAASRGQASSGPPGPLSKQAVRPRAPRSTGHYLPYVLSSFGFRGSPSTRVQALCGQGR